ncbi:MAG: DNA repair protein RecN [Betaproteobacteria bacterium]|nr:DNA repair protein RecN [Betaproteobacteria bacterium]
MLVRLSIRNFVIVESLDLDFAGGFTVLTGETGAGKSILIDAVACILGERADSSLIRAGSDRAELAAEFDLARLTAFAAWLEEGDFAGDDGLCLLRRVVEANGRSRGFINGRAATLQQLREAGEFLVDIHGQHAHQSLLRSDAQRALVDSFAGAGPLGQDVAGHYRRWVEAARRQREWEGTAHALMKERDELTWQVNELEGLGLGVGEWDLLRAEHARLAHAARLLEGARGGVDDLSEREGACLESVSAVISRLRALREYDESLGEALELLAPVEIQLQEAVHVLRRYVERLDLDPQRLQQCERRLDEIHSAARKYRTTPEGLNGLLADARARLTELGALDEADWSAQAAAAQEAYLAAARRLSELRRKAADTLSGETTRLMQELAMAGGRFEVGVSPLAEGTAHGLDQVEFLVSPHPGSPARPVAKTASGGELSRISLALDVVTSQVSPIPTLIFDEVDVGIGGRVAEIVGQMLKRLGRTRQVLCITHLPQVAALGEQHWQVVKVAADGSVASEIRVLDAEARVDEIARMLGGVDITDTTRRHAREMLGR